MTAHVGEWWVVAGYGPWKVLEVREASRTAKVTRDDVPVWVGMSELLMPLDVAYLEHFEATARGRIRRQAWLKEAKHWAINRGANYLNPGGNSALRAATRANPRNLPCPTCGAPDRLTPKDRDLGCDSCTDRDERGW